MKKRWLLSPDHDGMFTDLAKSDLAYSNLKGEVKTVISSIESIKRKNLFFEEEALFIIEEYNEIGNQISFFNCNGKKTIGTFTKFIYNKNNQVIEEVTYEENPERRKLIDEDITDQIIYTYHNNIIISEYWAGGSDDLYSAEYGTNGLINSIQVKSSLNIEKSWYLEREQNNSALITKIKETRQNYESIKYFKYDKFENIILIQQEIKNQIKDVLSYQYDEYNNLTKRTNLTSSKPLLAEFKYEYDDYKNWVRRYYYNNDGLSSIDNRTIIYY